MWKGSAALALEIYDRPFDRLVFIEQHQERCDSLRRLVAHHTERDVQIVNDDANRALPGFCESLASDERAVVFLDPFATQVSWHTVVTLAETKRVDCWILFPLSAVVRMMPGQRDPDPEWATHLDRVFGGRHWQQLYDTPPQLPLFGEEVTERSGGSMDVAELYRKRLETVFQKVAPTTKELRNSRNSPMFSLFFAASNPKGADIAVRIADHILNGW